MEGFYEKLRKDNIKYRECNDKNNDEEEKRG